MSDRVIEKKSKAFGGTRVAGKSNGSNVTDHYFNFVSSVLDAIDCCEHFYEHYLVINNAPIHKHVDIQKYIESYGCVYV